MGWTCKEYWLYKIDHFAHRLHSWKLAIVMSPHAASCCQRAKENVAAQRRNQRPEWVKRAVVCQFNWTRHFCSNRLISLLFYFPHPFSGTRGSSVFSCPLMTFLFCTSKPIFPSLQCLFRVLCRTFSDSLSCLFPLYRLFSSVFCGWKSVYFCVLKCFSLRVRAGFARLQFLLCAVLPGHMHTLPPHSPLKENSTPFPKSPQCWQCKVAQNGFGVKTLHPGHTQQVKIIGTRHTHLKVSAQTVKKLGAPECNRCTIAMATPSKPPSNNHSYHSKQA